MRNLQKHFFLAVFLLSIQLGTGQPSPPHEVYGEVTDSGTPVEGIEVKAVTSSQIFSSETGKDGYYRIQVPTEYTSFNLTAGEVNIDSNISIESGVIEEYSIQGDFIDDSNPEESGSGSSPSGGSSGGAGGGPAAGPGVQPSTSVQTENNSETVQARIQNNSGTASASIENISSNTSLKVQVSDNQRNFSVEEVSFSTSSVSSSGGVGVSVQDLREKPDTVEEAGTDVYGYQEINVSGLTDDEVASANITFRVNKTFVEDNRRTVDDVVMKRHKDGWKELPTKFRGETSSTYRFVANSKGFSYYAVSLREQSTSKQESSDTGVNASNRTVKEDKDKSTGSVLWAPLALGLTLILLILFAVRERNQKSDSDPGQSIKQRIKDLRQHMDEN